jgi:hypothetical protein
MARRVQVQSVEALSPSAPSAGLTEHELVALITVAAASVDSDPVYVYSLQQEMKRAGFTEVACALAVRGLEKKGMVERRQGEDRDGEYCGIAAPEGGLVWLEAHQERIKLKVELKSSRDYSEFREDDLPF